jgi:hypothetical protein
LVDTRIDLSGRLLRRTTRRTQQLNPGIESMLVPSATYLSSACVEARIAGHCVGCLLAGVLVWIGAALTAFAQQRLGPWNQPATSFRTPAMAPANKAHFIALRGGICGKHPADLFRGRLA